MTLLVGPIMTCMWLATSLLVFGLVPDIPILHALAVGACVTPTDPVLSNVIVKGKFADNNIPKDLQDLIIGESGANDGLGYPFLFFALYLIKYLDDGEHTRLGGAGTAIGLWFGETWGYTIILSAIYGAIVGWLARNLLWWASERKYVDRESFLVFSVSLALFIVGTCGMIGTDDVLACFIAGNAFTWDDWFRLETMDDSLQPTVDMLLNVSIFMWYGAVCPWSSFLTNSVIPLYRLIALGISVLLFRRLPFVWWIHKYVHQIEHARQAIFVGFFGPIGVSAIFYLYVTLEFLKTLEVDHRPRDDLENLNEIANVVVWFITICSIVSAPVFSCAPQSDDKQVVHGLSIPLGKLGYLVPRTLSRGFSTRTGDTEDEPPFSIHGRVLDSFVARPISRRSEIEPPEAESPEWSRSRDESQGTTQGRPVYRIGGSLIPRQYDLSGPNSQTNREDAEDEMANRPSQEITRPTESTAEGSMNRGASGQDAGSRAQLTVRPETQRTIRFHDGANARARNPSSLEEQDRRDD